MRLDQLRIASKKTRSPSSFFIYCKGIFQKFIWQNFNIKPSTFLADETERVTDLYGKLILLAKLKTARLRRATRLRLVERKIIVLSIFMVFYSDGLAKPSHFYTINIKGFNLRQLNSNLFSLHIYYRDHVELSYGRDPRPPRQKICSEAR